MSLWSEYDSLRVFLILHITRTRQSGEAVCQREVTAPEGLAVKTEIVIDSVTESEGWDLRQSG